MLVKHNIEEIEGPIDYFVQAECKCDRCNKQFYRTSDRQNEDLTEEETKEFLKKDFSLCNTCRLYIDKIKARQISFIRKEALCQ